MNGWTLHPQLAADTHFVTSLPLCDVLLMNDARWAWLILVPRIDGAREWIDLDRGAQHRLSDEVALASEALRDLHAPHKLNVAALGNVVAQLHVHVIARFREDAAWPRPVWGVGEAAAYASQVLPGVMQSLRDRLTRSE
ncbi:HIT domain-containing protein [Lysobacter claricitrinus]|uniref:HIT domain-containing protein n=1 Tax=Lysobacter claricitrinus TaxID=3367728 RepID=UPI0037DAE8C5